MVKDNRSEVDDLRLAVAILLDWCDRNREQIRHLPSLEKRLSNVARKLVIEKCSTAQV